MNFSCVNLGCKVNRVEIDTVATSLLELGWKSVSSDADVVVVNTCTVTGEADRKTRKEINRALAKHPSAQVLVTGCAAAIDPDALRALSDRVAIVPKEEIVERCAAIGGESADACLGSIRTGEGFRTRVGIKMQDGCDNACTYCIVHVARGPARSMPYDTCLRQALDLHRAGVHELVLTGIDLGAYCDKGKTIADFAADVLEQAPGMRIRISSIEPNSVDDKLVSLLAQADGMLCRHIHLPLQSGSSKVLSDMARHYDRDAYARIVHHLYECVPELSLSTDCIVGFPGETEVDFAQTVSLAQECMFSRIHVFRYSRRAGTPASSRTDQVDAQVKAERAARLSEVAARLRREEGKKRTGTREFVLVESQGRGMSESYFPVRLGCAHGVASAQGDLVECTLAHFGEDGVFTV